MKIGTCFKLSLLPGLLLAASIVSSKAVAAADAPGVSPLAGTWTLVAADVEHPDGTRGRDYGADPRGLLLIDAQGNYSLQIFKAERMRFASNDKAAGTATEYRDALLGASTHYGSITVNPVEHTLTFNIRDAVFPNWQGQRQTRAYELNGNELSYRVTPRPNGDIPVSIWRRLD